MVVILKASVRILGNFIENSKELTKVLQRSYVNASGLSYIHKIGKSPLVYRTIGQELSRVVDKYPDHEIVVAVEESRRITYEELKRAADTLAGGLQCLGLSRGDRLGILAPNTTIWPIAMFAAARAGLIMVALNPSHDCLQLEFYLQKVGIKALITSESFQGKNYYDKLLNLIPELTSSDPRNVQSKKFPCLTTVIIDSDKNFKGTFRAKDVMSMPAASQVNNIEDQQKDISPDSGCSIQFTSGSTGEPKAALLKHYAFVNSNLHIERMELGGRKLCHHVPIFHAYGTEMGIMASVSHQATIVIPSFTYKPEKSLLAIRNEKCTAILGTPAMYIDLVKIQRELQLDINLEIAVTGGAVCSPQLFKDMKAVLGVKKLKTCFGMTEHTGFSFTTLPSDGYDQVHETVGQVQDHIEVKVTDRCGKLVPFGTAGELWVRGYFTMLRYWNDKETTRKTLGENGWLRTGDQFILQSNGYGKFVGRITEMIVRDGEIIFPKDIENLLVTFPQIAEAYIIGVPDDDLGQEMCAFIRLRSAYSSLTAEDIMDYFKGNITDFPIPRYVEIVNEFPKTFSGKIPKYKLKQIFKEKYLKSSA
ncbi:medium-chain acyl-CoA ligase ACSF2, mitochondrial-like [Lutzomyia longipalpis]|uniref:medium-chain acyl-CoA ligase ACSF2, mitochondrial-like n=1 Tax=Lutzomyia longipalpis TaxID=7200 RepID=UPI0024846DA6|nr:medium-chain acyl-CoA ligase ACSF2, mitochondrial-like [Lutzomyia longipalpis]